MYTEPGDSPLVTIKRGAENKVTKEKIRAAIYVRVSTREQAVEGYSLESQERILTEYCKVKKYEITEVYRDEGISARTVKKRPGMMKLLKDAQERRFDVILVWKLTRFSRSVADLEIMCRELDSYGVMLISYSEAFDGSTPAGRMVRSMLGTVAQFEREVIAENVCMGLQERAMQGKRTCSTILGYNKLGRDSFVINEAEAEYVKFVFSTYLIRKNVSEVTELVKEKGYRGKRGRIPSSQSVYTILTHPEYAGYNIFHGELFKGDYKPIIHPKMYNKVQRLIMRQGKVVGQPRKRKLYIVPE